MAKSKEKAEVTEMMDDIKKTAGRRPHLAKKVALVTVKEKPADATRCILWGVDPVTGKRVCLIWE